MVQGDPRTGTDEPHARSWGAVKSAPAVQENMWKKPC